MKKFYSFTSIVTLVVIVFSTFFVADSLRRPFSKFGSEAKRVKCIDSDGYDPFVKGSLDGPKLTTGAIPTDYCITDQTSGEMSVVEYGCSTEDGWLNENLVVPGVFSNSVRCRPTDDGSPSCVDGACLYWQVDPTFYCEKSDGGDIYNKGTVYSDVSYLNGVDDRCVDNNDNYNLIEYTCFRPDPHTTINYGSTNAVFSNPVRCPDGCVDGECVSGKPGKGNIKK